MAHSDSISTLTPPAARARPLFDRLIFGNGDHRQRLRLKFALIASLVYVASIVTLAVAALVGFLSPRGVAIVAGYDLIGAVGFFLAHRFTVKHERAGEALLLPQVMYALLSLGLCYIVLPQTRGVLLTVTPLVLIFGARTSSPEKCQYLAWLAVAIFGTAMGITSMEPGADGKRLVFEFVCLLVLYPAMGRVAAMNATLRLASNQQRKALEAAVERINHLATFDVLTELPNRRHATDALTKAVAQMKRYKQPLCIAVMDIDHFKRVNDNFGHAVGDKVLRHVADVSRKMLRETDLIARWGGEEFLVLLPEADLATAAAVMERLRSTMARQQPCPDEIPALRVSFSAGLVSLNADESGEHAVDRADKLLYQAKTAGRDRVEIVPNPTGYRGG